uniref:Uncharacterized protein n=1 Tax=Setaria digitata TaxID=48799 RepID=A0A915PSD9_9BILA
MSFIFKSLYKFPNIRPLKLSVFCKLWKSDEVTTPTYQGQSFRLTVPKEDDYYTDSEVLRRQVLYVCVVEERPREQIEGIGGYLGTRTRATDPGGGEARRAVGPNNGPVVKNDRAAG